MDYPNPATCISTIWAAGIRADRYPHRAWGSTNIKRYAEALGYGRTLGIELPGEVAGLIPDADWKRINKGENWATGDTYISTIGQGYVEVTPLQVLESIATIGNGGKVIKPTLLKEYLDGEGNVTQNFPPQGASTTWPTM